MSKKVFLQRTPRRQKKSILKVNLRHYKNFLDQNYWLMKRSPLYCGHFATLGHILQLHFRARSVSARRSKTSNEAHHHFLSTSDVISLLCTARAATI